MKKILLLIGIMFSITLLNANTLIQPTGSLSGYEDLKIQKGKHLFNKYIKHTVKTDIYTISSLHTQDEWKLLKNNGNLKKEFLIISKKIKSNNKIFKAKNINYLFAVLYRYASDSGIVPVYES